MRRRIDALKRLRKAIDKRAKQVLKYGRWDCCTAAAELWKAQTGVDVMKRLRGYTTARGAALKLYHAAPKGTPKAKRFEAVVEIMARDAGLVEVPVSRAQRGFIVLLEWATLDGPADCLGIVDLDGQKILVPAVGGGWGRVPLLAGRRAWGIN